MKVEQSNDNTFTVELNDAELADLTAEADYSKLSLADIMRSICLMTFVQLLTCRYFRRMLRT